MGNAQGTERRMHNEAAHYEGDLCFVSFGAGGCFGRQQSPISGRAEHDDDRGSAEWERSRGLDEPVKGKMAHKPPSATKMKRPCLVSCSLGNCMAPARSIDDDDDDQDAHHRGREASQGESLFSCGFARIGCLGTPAWLNPAPRPRRPEMGSEELQRRVEADLAHLKARQATQHRHEMEKIATTKKMKKMKRKTKRGSGDAEISGPHLETFRRTTDHFISAHLAMCPDPRARVKLDSGENARVVSLEASAPPPPSTDGPWDDLDSDEASDRDDETPSLPPPVPGGADSRGRPAAPVADAKDGLPAPSHLPPPPPPPSPAS